MSSKELWLVQENDATVKLDSSVTSRAMNCEIYKFWRKYSKNSDSFLSSEQPRELKSLLDSAFNNAGVEKIRSENLRLRSTLEVIQSSSRFEWKES